MVGHTCEKRWRNNQTNDSGTGVSILESASALTLINVLTEAEELYQEINELYVFVGSDLQALADQLFYEDWIARESDPVGNPGVLDTEANATELAKATDLINATVAAHELYGAATNAVTATADRMAVLRRMS